MASFGGCAYGQLQFAGSCLESEFVPCHGFVVDFPPFGGHISDWGVSGGSIADTGGASGAIGDRPVTGGSGSTRQSVVGVISDEAGGT